MDAVRQLQRNVAAEAAIITAVSQSFGAVITPHQSVCGDLAAWPQVVYMSRLVKYLGAPLVDFFVHCTWVNASNCQLALVTTACNDGQQCS